MQKRALNMIAVISAAMCVAACGSSTSSSASTTASATSAAAETEAAESDVETTQTSETESAEEMGPAMKRIKESGKIVLGMDSAYPPLSWLDPTTNKPDGIMVEFSNKLAEKLGVEPEYRPEAFGTLISDLSSDNIDVICATVTVTEERKEVMLFTDTFVQMSDCMLVRTEDKDKYKSLDDFAGKTVVGNSGASQYDHAASIPGVTAIAADGTSDGVLQVVAGTVDAAVVDNITGQQYIQANDGKLTMLTDINFGYDDHAIAVKIGNEDLQAVCNEIVNEMVPNMDQLIHDYTAKAVKALGVQ